MNAQKIFWKSRTKLLIAGGCLVFVILAITAISIMNQPGEVTILTESALKEILLVSEVSTLKYTYNSITAVPNANDPKYHVAYEGSVKAGFDLSNITVEKFDKTYIITLPTVSITEVNVNTNMDYIFIKNKYNTDTTYQEAYNKATEDLRAKAEANESLLVMARENAISTIKAWLKPWEAQLPAGYAIEVR